MVASIGHHPYVSTSSSRTMQHMQARQHQPTDRDWGSPTANKKEDNSKAIVLNLMLNLLSNFYSILDNTAPPNCWVNEQNKVYNSNKIKEGLLDGSIPSAIADSGATSNVGTTRDKTRKAFVATGQKLDKAFCMPNGQVEEANIMDELQHNVRHPTKDVLDKLAYEN